MIKRLLKKLEEIYRYRYFARNEKGAYQFLLQKIYKSTDVDFLQHAWQLDYFREVLVPEPLALESMKKILVLAPHQDDEVLGCGGTLHLLSKQGCSITLLFLTDGAELSHPDTSVQVRKQESEEVAKSLGANHQCLDISNIHLKINRDTLEQLTQILEENWDAIFTVWPLDGPAKHRLCSYITGKALQKSNYIGNIVFYAVHTELLPNKYVDIGNVIDEKQRLISLYPSQLKDQNYAHLSYGLDAWRSRFLPASDKARYIETFMEVPAKSYQDFQVLFNRSNASKLFKGNEACIQSFKNLQKL